MSTQPPALRDTLGAGCRAQRVTVAIDRVRAPDRFPLVISGILVAGLLSALLDAVIGWENLAGLMIARLTA